MTPSVQIEAVHEVYGELLGPDHVVSGEHVILTAYVHNTRDVESQVLAIVAVVAVVVTTIVALAVAATEDVIIVLAVVVTIVVAVAANSRCNSG